MSPNHTLMSQNIRKERELPLSIINAAATIISKTLPVLAAAPHIAIAHTLGGGTLDTAGTAVGVRVGPAVAAEESRVGHHIV